MGGHGALTLYLASRSKQYKSASAFAPITNPTKCPWGQKAFKGYLQGGVQEASNKYDATDLIAKATESIHILIDYVRHFLNIQERRMSLLSRELGTTSSCKDNYCLKTSWMQPDLLVMMNSKLESGDKKAMITVTTLCVLSTIQGHLVYGP